MRIFRILGPLLFLFMSCYKEDAPRATILVLHDSVPIYNATLEVRANNTDSTLTFVDVNYLSDKNGKINFEVPFECYLNLHAIFYTDSTWYLTGRTNIHMEVNKHIKDTIWLR